jgi:hypothetical protein
VSYQYFKACIERHFWRSGHPAIEREMPGKALLQGKTRRCLKSYSKPIPFVWRIPAGHKIEKSLAE